jgi:hypothetical protein
MKLYIKYQTDIQGWRRHQVDTNLMYFYHNRSYKHVRSWEVLLNCIENNYMLIVLQEDPEPTPDGFDYDDFISKIDYVINSSKILFVEPKEELKEVPLENVTVDQYLNEDEKKKREEKMEKLARHLGKPR